MPELYPWWAAEYLLRAAGWSNVITRITASFTPRNLGIPTTLHETWKLHPDPLFLIVQGSAHNHVVKSAWRR